MKTLRNFFSKKLFGKLSVAVLAILLALGVTAGSLAYMFVNTNTVTNQFVPGEVSCYVAEDLTQSGSNTVKDNIQIQNTGNVLAKIRVKVVVNWVDADGNICGAEHPSFTLPAPATGWTKSGDYYVYSSDVAPAEYTTELFATPITMQTASDGCKLQIEIIASAIQAEGGAGWGVTPSGN